MTGDTLLSLCYVGSHFWAVRSRAQKTTCTGQLSPAARCTPHPGSCATPSGRCVRTRPHRLRSGDCQGHTEASVPAPAQNHARTIVKSAKHRSTCEGSAVLSLSCLSHCNLTVPCIILFLWGLVPSLCHTCGLGTTTGPSLTCHPDENVRKTLRRQS